MFANEITKNLSQLHTDFRRILNSNTDARNQIMPEGAGSNEPIGSMKKSPIQMAYFLYR